MPLSRSYARYILGDKPADKIMGFLSSLYFWKVHGYWPDFKNPRSFSEKIWNRMLFNRDPIWTMVSDKMRVREYVVSKVCSEYLIPVLWSGDNPNEIPFSKLPLSFVIKANHGCKYNIIVKDKTQLDVAGTKFKLKKWLETNYCQSSLVGAEWAYKNIDPVLMVEAFLDCNGTPPLDYKFFCYSGRAEFLQVSFDRFGDASERFLDKDFCAIDLWNGLKLFQGKIDRPDNYKEMVQVAETLALDFEFIRVDLYNVNGRIFVGELTCYPAGGIARFIPQKYDFIFGDKWN
jgi:hypothetical protein